MKQNTIKINKKNTLMVAHRGLSGLEKENTACSFIAAGQHTYYGAECDIHLTKDHKYVICHDGNLLRVSGQDVEIKDNTLEDLLKVQLLDNFDMQPKPYYQVITLEEYLKICKKYDLRCIIEYKDDFSKEEVQEVIDIINSLEYLDHVVFISFKRQPLVYTRELLKDIEIQLLVGPLTEDDVNFCKEYKMGLDAYYESVNEEVIKTYHEAGLKVNAWTVNMQEVGEKLVEMGIDYITTNILE